jgi:hypothetical protein
LATRSDPARSGEPASNGGYWVIFHPELDGFGDVLPEGLRCDRQREIDASRHPATRYQLSVDNDPLSNGERAERR